jgi:hypothetical protein
VKKTRYVMRLVVEGSTPFPLDMLRYDSAVPASEEESRQIERCASHSAVFVGKVKIALRRFAVEDDYDTRQPSDTPMMANRRWESFGWRVVSYEREEST